jgi:hypothetical protein
MGTKYCFAAAFLTAALSASAANASTYSPYNASGGFDGIVSISDTLTNGTVDTGFGDVLESWYVNPTGNGSAIPNQNASDIASFFTNQGASVTTAEEVSGMSQSSLSGDSITETGTGADLFAIHFDSQELLFQFNYLVTSITISLSCPTSAKCDATNALSNIYAFDDGTFLSPPTKTVAATPLPAALPLFASGLGAMGLFGWRRKRRNAATRAAA